MKIGIIGGGIAGLAIARDALINGIDVIILEKSENLEGASINNGAVLHSGARYLVENKKIAKLCLEENRRIRKIAPFATGKRNGIFLTEKDLDPKIEKTFINTAAEIGMPLRRISLLELKGKINFLSPNIKYGYETPDTIFNPYILTQAYIKDIEFRGGEILFGSELTSVKPNLKQIELGYQGESRKMKKTNVDFLINCTGKDLSKVARLFGSKIEVDNIEGAMYISREVFSDHFLTICGVNFDGNAIVPIKGASSIGSTWITKEQSEKTLEDKVRNNVQRLVNKEVIFDEKSTIRAFRTHFKSNDHTRSAIDYGIYDHSEEGIKNIFSILPGKFVLHRMVAEETLDRVLATNNLKRKGKTSQYELKMPTTELKKMIEYTL
jgi:glycerol-3-phosphate dehydrogenase